MTNLEMFEECVIVGGGVAGLSAANALADAGLGPLLIEAGEYPAHRICGEFLSPECLPILRRWDIVLPISIQECHLFNRQKRMGFQLPAKAGSCSRYIFDEMLHKRALSKGARILTNTTVSSLDLPQKHSQPYTLNLSTGQIIKSNHLILGTGRIPNMNQNPTPKYMGFKAHFEGIFVNHVLEMHCFNGGYLGISPVDETTSNIACLVKRESIDDINPHTFISSLLEEKSLQERLLNAIMLFSNWLTGQLPEFGIRTQPAWDRVFWIGDAAGSIPPISGEGLAIGITSGCMAAEYFMKSNAAKFNQAWLKRYRSRFFWACRLHRIMLSPWMNKVAIDACHLFPSLPPLVWNLTRENVGNKK